VSPIGSRRPDGSITVSVPHGGRSKLACDQKPRRRI